MIKNETDLYLPVQRFFSELGFKVDAEVRDCDIVASKDDIVVICELKEALLLNWYINLLIERK